MSSDAFSEDALAGDYIDGRFHQRVKAQFGADGSATDVSAISRLPVESSFSASNLTAFGDLQTASVRPFIQSTAAYNLIPANFREFTASGGSTGAENKMFYAESGTSAGGYGAIQSFRSLNYKAGEGGLARFTARFVSNAASSWQGVGLINLSDELSFGYNGTDFGIWHRYGGFAEVRTLTVSTGASGSENATLTLNGTGYTVPLTAGTVQHNAAEIADWVNADATAGAIWAADQLDDTVIFVARSDGAKSGSYTLSSSSAAGTFAQNTAGVTKTSDHIAQADWNGDSLQAALDPSKGNVYQIAYQYLGFGAIYFFVEEPSTGRMVKVHTIRYANANTAPSLTNPSLRLGLYAVNISNTTSLKVYSASMAGFVVGGNGQPTRNPRAAKNTQTITTSQFTNILTIRNRQSYNSYPNQQEIEPLSLTIANESGKNVEVEVRGGATLGSGEVQNFQATGTNLISDADTTANAVSGGRLLAAFTVGGTSSVTFNLADERIRIPPSLDLAISGKLTSGASAPVTATLVWYEDL